MGLDLAHLACEDCHWRFVKEEEAGMAVLVAAVESVR